MIEEDIVGMKGYYRGRHEPPTEGELKEYNESMRKAKERATEAKTPDKQDRIIELLEKLNANVKALVTAELYNAEFQERLMKSLTGESENKVLKSSLEQEARMAAYLDGAESLRQENEELA